MNKIKDLEGETVYLLPTGNHARHWNSASITEGKITKIARVNITFEIRGVPYTYRIGEADKNGNETFTMHSQANSGYRVFTTKREFIDEVNCEKMAVAIMRKMNRDAVKSLGSDMLRFMAKKFGVEVELLEE